MRRITKDGWILISLILLLTVVSALTDKTKDEAAVFNRTSYSYQPNGTGALYETLHTLGYKPQRYLYSLDNLAGNGVVFIISPSVPLSKSEMVSLERWASRGNLIVYADADLNQLISNDDGKLLKYRTVLPSVFSANAQSVDVSGGINAKAGQ